MLLQLCLLVLVAAEVKMLFLLFFLFFFHFFFSFLFFLSLLLYLRPLSSELAWECQTVDEIDDRKEQKLRKGQ
jgi:hypothetical protein